MCPGVHPNTHTSIYKQAEDLLEADGELIAPLIVVPVRPGPA